MDEYIKNNGLLLDYKKEWSADTYDNRDELWKHYAKGKNIAHQTPRILFFY